MRRLEAIEDRLDRMVLGTPWVASCTVTVEADAIESCSGPEAAELDLRPKASVGVVL